MNNIETPKYNTRLDSANIVSSGSGDVYVGGSFVPTPTIPVNNSNLPHPPTNFVGRKEEIRRVIDALKSRAWIITIDGMGGIGKTTLALQIAHLCKTNLNEYTGLPEFQGFVWTSARDKPSYGLDDVVQEILYVLSPFETNTKPLSQSERLSLAIRALSAEPRLLIIDNFETVQDEPLHRFLRDQLPDPSKVLITSRHHIKTGERVVTIGGLEESEAVELLRLEATRLQIPLQEKDSARLEIIARKSYGIPLVLRWVMESVYNGKSLEWVLESLEHASADDIFNYIFQRSLTLLDRETRRVFRSMALLSTWARLDALMAINQGVPALQERVGQLVSLSLVEDNRNLTENSRRYQLPPFTRYIARKELSEEPIRYQLHANALHHYLSQLIELGSRERATEYLFEESDNIDHLVESAAATTDFNLLKLGIQLAQSVSAINRERGEVFFGYILAAVQQTDNLEVSLKLLQSIGSPYVAGVPVRSPMFFGRDRLLGFIRSRFEDAHFLAAIFLIGPRRIGKTSILHELSHQYSDKCVYVLMDMQGLREMDTGSFLYQISRKILRSIQERESNVELPSIESFSARPFQSFESYLQESLSELGNARIVLMLDEFELMFRQEALDVQGLLSFFRYLVNTGLLGIITAGVTPPSELPSPEAGSPFFNIGHLQRVSFLDRAAAINLIKKPTHGLLKFDPEAIERLILLTGGHPYLLQLLCQLIVEACLRKAETWVGIEAINDAQEELFQTSSFFFYNLFEWIGEDGQKIARIAASISNELGEFTLLELEEEIKRVKKITARSYHKTMRVLDTLEVIRSTDGEKHKFTMEAFRLWLLRDHPTESA